MLVWDEAKRTANMAKHGVDFAEANQFDWDSALTLADDRFSYGEPRYASIGFIHERLHVVVWTPRDGKLRLIGVRKANDREQRRYFARCADDDAGK